MSSAPRRSSAQSNRGVKAAPGRRSPCRLAREMWGRSEPSARWSSRCQGTHRSSCRSSPRQEKWSPPALVSVSLPTTTSRRRRKSSLLALAKSAAGPSPVGSRQRRAWPSAKVSVSQMACPEGSVEQCAGRRPRRGRMPPGRVHIHAVVGDSPVMPLIHSDGLDGLVRKENEEPRLVDVCHPRHRFR